jgi:iron complex transport system substrate-binding protein
MNRLPALAIAAIAAANAHALQVIDDRGATIRLDQPAQRIVSLAPHLAEIAFAAGAGKRLVGVSAVSRHPAEAARLPVVASHGAIDIERIIALQPDLVLAWRSGNPPLQIERLERLGFPVLETETSSLADVPRIIRLVGKLAGTESAAEESAEEVESQTRSLARRYAGASPVTVFVEIWHRPMLTLSGAHLVSDAIRLCAGRNVFAGARTLTPLVSREQVLVARPEAIVVTAGDGGEDLSAWRGFEPVPAVRRHRIYAIDPDLLYDQGPRVIEGVRALCERLDLARR